MYWDVAVSQRRDGGGFSRGISVEQVLGARLHGLDRVVRFISYMRRGGSEVRGVAAVWVHTHTHTTCQNNTVSFCGIKEVTLAICPN